MRLKENFYMPTTDTICFKMTPSLTVIIPTLNEERGIVKTLKQINKLGVDEEVLVVDGLSTDNTIRNAKEYGAGFHETRVPLDVCQGNRRE